MKGRSRQFEAEADLEQALLEYCRAYGIKEDELVEVVDILFKGIEEIRKMK